MAAVVFFVPHQDDEILSQGASIQQHVAAGRDVNIVLMTDGQASGARETIRTERGISLSESAFSKARDREFLDCLSRLGIPQSKVYFENLKDGGVTRVRTKEIFRDYITKFPGGAFKTMSWMDAHPDHHMLGRCLDELDLAGDVPGRDVRFIRSARYPGAVTPGGSNQRGDDAIVCEAATAYNVWAPNRVSDASDMSRGPRYAIGYTSVNSYFTELLANPVSFTHVGSGAYNNADRIAANKWLRGKGHVAYL